MVPVPATLTETTFEPEAECTMCEMNLRKKSCSAHVAHTSDPPGTTNGDNYDIMLPKNESKPMERVRKWEKSLGFVTPLRWTNIVTITLLHLITVVWFGAYLSRGWIPKWETVVFSKCEKIILLYFKIRL